VLATVEPSGKGTCITLPVQKFGSTPKQLFEEAIIEGIENLFMAGDCVVGIKWLAM